MLSTLYITFIFLSFYDIVGSNASKETYLIETNAESFLTPGTFDANSHKGTQYLTSNEPIFVKDILVYHPDYYNIKYSRIKDTQLEDGAYIVETSEERLINTIVESRDLETLFKKEPSAYFVTEKYVPSNSMEISIKCSVDINPTIVDLSIFGERSSQKDSIFFFPGCYRENLTFQAVNPLQDVFIEKNIYKIENIPSDQINSVVLENTPVTYLKLDKIHNRLAYSYISLGSNLESNGILAVGTDEGSYLEKRFMQLVNNSNTKDGFNLTLVLSYFKKSGFFDKDEKIKIDSLNDDVYIEILNGTLD